MSVNDARRRNTAATIEKHLRARGTPNKLTHEAQTLIARIIAGSVDELTLKVLAVDNPEVYAELINSPTVQRVFALKRGGPNSLTKPTKRKRPVLNMPNSKQEVDQALTTIQRIKEQKKLDGMTDIEVVTYDALAKGIPQNVVAAYLDALGPGEVAKQAYELRYKWLESEQKRERLADTYIKLKRGGGKSSHRKTTVDSFE